MISLPPPAEKWVADTAEACGLGKTAFVRALIMAAMESEAGTLLANAKLRNAELSDAELGQLIQEETAGLSRTEAKHREESIRFAHRFCSHSPRKRGWCDRSTRILRLWCEAVGIPMPDRKHPAILTVILNAGEEIGWNVVEWIVENVREIPYAQGYHHFNHVWPDITRLLAGPRTAQIVDYARQRMAQGQRAPRKEVRREAGVVHYDDGSVRAEEDGDAVD